MNNPGGGSHVADRIAAQFVSLGMSPADAASRAELFATLATQSEPILYGPAEWRRFTPGRIEIFGKHTDYAGGHSLLAAVPRGIALEARRRADDVVRVGDIFDGQVIEVDPATEAPPRYRGRRALGPRASSFTNSSSGIGRAKKKPWPRVAP